MLAYRKKQEVVNKYLDYLVEQMHVPKTYIAFVTGVNEKSNQIMFLRIAFLIATEKQSWKEIVKKLECALSYDDPSMIVRSGLICEIKEKRKFIENELVPQILKTLPYAREVISPLPASLTALSNENLFRTLMDMDLPV